MTTPAGLLAAARTLAIDGWTAEAVRALRADGVDVLLLKGPALSRWLYPRAEERDYVDADLLVAPETVTRAEAALVGLGYELRDPAGEAERLVSGPHAQTWWRPSDYSLIDLHHTLPGEVHAESIVWSRLWARAVTMEVGGESVRILDPGARAVLVALHAGHHGAGSGWPEEDLRRAVATLPLEVWRDAMAVADELMTLPQVARALELVPGGAELARAVGLPDPDLLESTAERGMAAGFARLAAAPKEERVRLLREEIFPTRAFMHWWAPWSRGSGARLAAAYVYRTGWLAVHAIPGYLAWRRARRTA